MKTLTTRLLISALLPFALAACACAAQPVTMIATAMVTNVLPTVTALESETPVPLTFTPSASATPSPTNTDTLVPIVAPSLTQVQPTAIPTWGIVSTQAYTDGMVGLYVPAGNFLMGSTNTDIAQTLQECPSCEVSGERPQHSIYLDAFWIDQTEVTNAMYAACVKDGKCLAPSQTKSSTRSDYYGNVQYERDPVLYVSWNDAQAYCTWTGRRLPTEAEFEKSARGVDGRLYPWGNQAASSTLANFNQNVKDTTEVGKYADGASPYGALDMTGNVWEWVADWYSEKYYASSPIQNPVGPASGQYHVLRGGAWNDGARVVRVAFRGRDFPVNSYDNIGFRCARSP